MTKKKACIVAAAILFAIASSVFFSDAIKDSSLNAFGWILRILTYAVLALSVVLCFRKMFVIEKVFLLIAIPLGLLYMVLMTPLSIPDEHFHYQTSYELSNRLLFKTGEAAEMGEAEHFDYTHFPLHQNNSEGYERFLNEIFQKAPERELVQMPSHRSLVYFMMQLPQAIGISIGRVFGANFVTIFYLGRLLNLLAYICCAYLAIKAVPCLKGLFFLIGILPMTLHQAASFSYDGMTFALTLLTIALYMRAYSRKDIIQRKEFFELLVVGTLMAPVKAGYIPILLMAFLIPKSRFITSKKRWITIGMLLGTAMAALALAWIPAIIAGKATIHWNWECYSLSYVIAYPLSTIKIFVNTIRIQWFDWLMMAIGSKMSGLVSIAPMYICIGYLFLLVFAAFGSREEQRLYPITNTQRYSFLGIFGVCFLLIMGAMFFTWTEIGSKEVSGVQGRYFIPVIPLLLMCLNNKHITFKESKDRVFVLTAMFLHVNLLNNIIMYTLNR